MKIDYVSGGFFKIENIRWSASDNYHMDMEILIENGATELLQKVEEHKQDDGSILHKFIAQYLNGVVRVTQFYKDPTGSNLLASMYEGQITGMATGFGRIIESNYMGSYIGYYKDGYQHG